MLANFAMFGDFDVDLGRRQAIGSNSRPRRFRMPAHRSRRLLRPRRAP